jgi:hypothetical protein
MATRLDWAFSVLAAVALGIECAQALPVSSCDGVTCKLYESDADGNGTERPPAVTLGFNPKPGYLVINEKGTDPIAQSDDRTWSEVLLFMGNTVQLFSDSFIFKGQEGEDVPFTRIDVIDSKFDGVVIGTTVFMAETNPPTNYQPVREQPFQGITGGPGDPANGTQASYMVFSDVVEGDDKDLPEPGSAILIAGAASYLCLPRRRRSRCGRG